MDKAFVWEGRASQSPLPLCRCLDPFGYFLSLFKYKSADETLLRHRGAAEVCESCAAFYKVKYNKESV